MSVSVPPRSRLYNLEPIGIGTGSVECLTSYVSRLAAAHCLSPAVLLGRTFAPLMGKKYWLQGGARPGTRGSALGNSFSEHAKAINGIGTIARDWVTALENLTLRNDIRFLTMLPWAEVFTQRNLLRSSRAWCPTCYQDRLANNQVIYEPLLWTFRDVEVCVKHQRRLSTQCQHCGRKLAWLARCGQPGYCSKCGEWLGTRLYQYSTDMVIPLLELEWQTWVAQNLEELISAATYLSPPPKERMAKALSVCINQAFEGIMNRFACLIGKRKTTVWGWQREKAQIPIDDLLRICRRFGLSLVDFLYAESLVLNIELIPPMASASGVKATRRSPRPLERNTTERALRTILNEQPPLPMKTVATRLNLNKRLLYKHFPELCKSISATHKEHQRVYQEQLRRSCAQELGQLRSSLHNTGVYPSRRRIAAAIRLKNGNRVGRGKGINMENVTLAA